MIWISDYPSAEGWYFWRKNAKTNEMYWVMYFYEEDAGLWLGNYQVRPVTGGQWAGPIPTPAEQEQTELF